MSSTTPTPRSGVAAGRRPHRGVQALIWLLFAAALAAGLGLSQWSTASAGGGGLPTQPRVVAAGALVAGQEKGQGTAGAATSSMIQDRYLWAETEARQDNNPLELLPAYRWRGDMDLNTQLGTTDKLMGGGIASAIAELLFNTASWMWWLLLWVVKLAVSIDLVASAGSAIDGQFKQVADGLGASGLPMILAVLACGIAALRVLRGKVSESISIVMGAVLVLGGLSFMTSAAGSPNASTTPGSPSYIATKGNEFVNTMAGQLTTGFGAANSMTSQVRSGAFATTGDTDGATCSYYVQRLYNTYAVYSGSDPKASGIAQNALSMVSFMWQRGMYDQYTVARFGSLADGSRIVCHELEHSAGIEPLEQFAIVGGEGLRGTANAGPYATMHAGPFFRKTDQDKHDNAAVFAWAACGAKGASARPGWLEAGWPRDDRKAAAEAAGKQCAKWWTWPDADGIAKLEKSGSKSIDSGAVGINAGGGDDVLKWKDKDAVVDATTPHTTDKDAAAALGEVRSVVLGYYGHNSGTRMLSGFMAVATAGLYLYAFGATAAGTIVAQFGLLFFLAMLPYTLLVLAAPSRDGGRSQLGQKMLKMTGAFFAGKLVFLSVLGATIQLSAMLFNLTLGMSGGSSKTAGSAVLAVGADGVGGSYAIWSLIIPAATIFIMRSVTKGLGLGNLMSLSGAAGLATSAALASQGKEGRKTASKFQGALKESKAGRGLDWADKHVKDGVNAPGRKMTKYWKDGAKSDAEAIKRKRASKAIEGAVAAEEISPQMAADVASGKMSLEQAKAQHAATQAGLPNDLAKSVGRGDLTLEQAEAIHKAAQSLEDAGETLTERGDSAADGPEALTDLGPDHGGVAGALERMEGGPSAKTEPVFTTTTFEPTADRSAVIEMVQDANGVFVPATRDASPESYQDRSSDVIDALVDTLMAATRPAEEAFSKLAAAASVIDDLSAAGKRAAISLDGMEASASSADHALDNVATASQRTNSSLDEVRSSAQAVGSSLDDAAAAGSRAEAALGDLGAHGVGSAADDTRVALENLRDTIVDSTNPHNRE